jgi:hypothetical protein
MSPESLAYPLTNGAFTETGGGVQVAVECPSGQAGRDEVQEEVEHQQGRRQAASDPKRHRFV